MKKIIVSDITLKNMATEREAALLFREKTSVAACADSIGADIIELAPVKNLREDMIIYKTIASKIKNAALAIPAGFDKESVKAAGSVGKGKRKRNYIRIVGNLQTL